VEEMGEVKIEIPEGLLKIRNEGVTQGSGGGKAKSIVIIQGG
jgi:hypothetical protein